MRLTKENLRRELLSRRRGMDKYTKKKSDESIHTKLIALMNERKPRQVLCYVSTPIEVDTSLFLSELLERQEAVYVPRCAEGNMRFFRIGALSELRKGAFGIPEPIGSEEFHGETDSVCITPALSFDRDGYRLGYGGGYYDRFLKNYRGLSVGICYQSFLGEIPKEPFDLPVDLLITDEEVIDLRQRRKETASRRKG